MRRILDPVLDVIYEPKCLCCGGVSGTLPACCRCMDAIHFLCREVLAPVHKNYSRLWVLAAYEDPWLELIHKFKYGRETAAEKLIEIVLKNHIEVKDDINAIVPVPLHWRRYFVRGYNQSVIIANMISQFTDKPLFSRALIKSAVTPRQVGLSLSERTKNLRGSFRSPRLSPQSVSGLKILLVDDVVTSGATINECSRVLKLAGAARVDVLTLAKAI